MSRMTARRDELQAQVFLCQQLQVREWLQNVLRRTDILDDLSVALNSGEILCHMLNAIKPDLVPSVREDASRRIENIDNFLRGCRELGVPEQQLFEAADLLELRNMSKVVRCMMSIISQVTKTIRTDLPKLPPPPTTISFSQGQIQRAIRQLNPTKDSLESPKLSPVTGFQTYASADSRDSYHSSSTTGGTTAPGSPAVDSPTLRAEPPLSPLNSPSTTTTGSESTSKAQSPDSSFTSPVVPKKLDTEEVNTPESERILEEEKRKSEEDIRSPVHEGVILPVAAEISVTDHTRTATPTKSVLSDSPVVVVIGDDNVEEKLTTEGEKIPEAMNESSVTEDVAYSPPLSVNTSASVSQRGSTDLTTNTTVVNISSTGVDGDDDVTTTSEEPITELQVDPLSQTTVSFASSVESSALLHTTSTTTLGTESLDNSTQSLQSNDTEVSLPTLSGEQLEIASDESPTSPSSAAPVVISSEEGVVVQSDVAPIVVSAPPVSVIVAEDSSVSVVLAPPPVVVVVEEEKQRVSAERTSVLHPEEPTIKKPLPQPPKELSTPPTAATRPSTGVTLSPPTKHSQSGAHAHTVPVKGHKRVGSRILSTALIAPRSTPMVTLQPRHCSISSSISSTSKNATMQQRVAEECCRNMVQLRDWIVSITGAQLPKESHNILLELRDGVVLMELLDRAFPEHRDPAYFTPAPRPSSHEDLRSVPARPVMRFEPYRANRLITQFIRGCARVGVTQLFAVEDLSEMRDIFGVVSSLLELAQLAEMKDDVPHLDSNAPVVISDGRVNWMCAQIAGVRA